MNRFYHSTIDSVFFDDQKNDLNNVPYNQH